MRSKHSKRLATGVGVVSTDRSLRSLLDHLVVDGTS